MSWKTITALVVPLVVIGVFLVRLLPALIGSSEPAPQFLTQPVLIPNISSYDNTGVTIGELHDFYRFGQLSNVSWERLDQRRVILHASGQDALTKQTIVLAWQFLSVGSEQEAPHTLQGPRSTGAYVEQLAVNGENAPMPVIQMAMSAIVSEIVRKRAMKAK